MSQRARIREAGAVAAALLAFACPPVGLGAQPRVVLGRADAVEARIWLDRGADPVVQQGDRLRVYYRAAQDAYVAIFRIDTDGTATLAFPHSPDEDHYVRGGRDYRLIFPRSPYWVVDDAPGVGYFFIVASADPFDFSRFRFSAYDRGWDLSRVGRQVHRDPWVAMDDYVAALLPDWETAPYALDFTSYDVGQRHDYPRFLCYQCHTFRAYSAWNPYYTACTDFRVVLYDDPYFYPARRYRGDRVVWAQPPSGDRARFAFKERARGEPSGVVVAPRPPAEPRSPVRTAVPRRPTAAAPGAERPADAGAPPADARERPVLQRRPSEGASAPPPSRPATRRPTSGGGASGGSAPGGASAEPRSGAPAQPRSAPTRPPSSAGGARESGARESGSSERQPAERQPAVRRTPDGRPVVR